MCSTSFSTASPAQKRIANSSQKARGDVWTQWRRLEPWTKDPVRHLAASAVGFIDAGVRGRLFVDGGNPLRKCHWTS